MLKVELKGGKVDAKDGIDGFITLEANDFQAIGPRAYQARAHSSNGIITGRNGQKYQLVNFVIGNKGLVTVVIDAEQKVLEGEEATLNFTEVVDGRARFNVVTDLPTA